MTPADFLDALESELRLRAVPFDQAKLRAFVADCWPWIDEDPDVPAWAGEFLAAGKAAVGAGREVSHVGYCRGKCNPGRSRLFCSRPARSATGSPGGWVLRSCGPVHRGLGRHGAG